MTYKISVLLKLFWQMIKDQAEKWNEFATVIEVDQTWIIIEQCAADWKIVF